MSTKQNNRASAQRRIMKKKLREKRKESTAAPTPKKEKFDPLKSASEEIGFAYVALLKSTNETFAMVKNHMDIIPNETMQQYTQSLNIVKQQIELLKGLKESLTAANAPASFAMYADEIDKFGENMALLSSIREDVSRIKVAFFAEKAEEPTHVL